MPASDDKSTGRQAKFAVKLIRLCWKTVLQALHEKHKSGKLDITAISLFTKTVLQEIQQNSYLQLISGPQSDLSLDGTYLVVCLLDWLMLPTALSLCSLHVDNTCGHCQLKFDIAAIRLMRKTVFCECDENAHVWKYKPEMSCTAKRNSEITSQLITGRETPCNHVLSGQE